MISEYNNVNEYRSDKKKKNSRSVVDDKTDRAMNIRGTT